MFYYQSSSLGPNLINSSIQQEQLKANLNRRLFKDIGNQKTTSKFKNRSQCKPVSNQQEKKQEVIIDGVEKIEEEGMEDELVASKRPNLIMQFSSQDQPQEQQYNKKQSLEKGQSKNKFLLQFSDDQNSQELCESVTEFNYLQPTQRKSNKSKTELLPQRNKNNLVLNFDDSQEENNSKESIQSMPSPKIITKSLLSCLMDRRKQKYYIEPIRQGQILHCIIKRQKGSSGVKYHLYDSTTLRNFITVVKNQDGYAVISKESYLSNQQSVVGKIFSNFFGTQFNCYSCFFPYKKNIDISYNPKTDKQSITIEYQTNIFGLKGPRKMTAFIFKDNKQATSNKKHLNELYQYQKKKNLPKTIQKFKNKTPKWDKSIQAYVLNFYGRATISSIKNFIMIKQDQTEKADSRLLFGKYGKQLFNLDIRSPFNLLQGLALALSSFDKKIACE